MRVNKVGYKRVKELWKKLKVLIEANKEKLKDMAKEQNNDRNLRRKRVMNQVISIEI